MTNVEMKIIKPKIGLLELAKQLLDTAKEKGVNILFWNACGRREFILWGQIR